jgi:hypothetical protein
MTSITTTTTASSSDAGFLRALGQATLVIAVLFCGLALLWH